MKIEISRFQKPVFLYIYIIFYIFLYLIFLSEKLAKIDHFSGILLQKFSLPREARSDMYIIIFFF